MDAALATRHVEKLLPDLLRSLTDEDQFQRAAAASAISAFGSAAAYAREALTAQLSKEQSVITYRSITDALSKL
jgi:HEAT repeat protein